MPVMRPAKESTPQERCPDSGSSNGHSQFRTRNSRIQMGVYFNDRKEKPLPGNFNLEGETHGFKET